MDYGNLKGELLDLVASNVLVLLASGLQKPWFVTIGQFLTNSVNADILQDIIVMSINLLIEKEAEVRAVTFNGSPKHISMANKLGCKVEKLDRNFDHPSKQSRKVNFLLDVCHMNKLARNTFGDIKIFCHPSGERISCEHIIALHHVQQKDNPHLEKQSMSSGRTTK